MTTRQPTVLLVDDELPILNALRRCLRDEPYRVITTVSPEEALRMMKTEQVDVIVSDYYMPEMTGIELLERIRDRFPDSQRLILTGQADMKATIEAINRGEIFRFLLKPWDDNQLKEALRAALNQLRLRRENRKLISLAQHQHWLLRGGAAEDPQEPPAGRDATGAFVLDEDDSTAEVTHLYSVS